MQEVSKEIEIGELSKARHQRAEGYYEALAWVLAGSSAADPERLTTEELLLAIFHQLEEIKEYSATAPGLPTGPENRQKEK